MMPCAQINIMVFKKETNMKKKYTKKQIQEAISYWEKQLSLGNYKKLNEDENVYDENQRDEYGFTRDDTDVFLFDIIDGTGKKRNGAYDHLAVRTNGAIQENDVKRKLSNMARVWTQNALRRAKKEIRKEHRQLRSYEVSMNTLNVDNIQHMTKQQFIDDDSLGEIRFIDLDG